MNVRSRGGIPLGSGASPRADLVRERIRDLLSQGESDLATARALGVSDRTVRRFRQRHGIRNFYERAAL